MISKLLRGLAPVAALAMGALAAGCDDVSVRIGDDEGVRLADLDMSGPPPKSLALASPDSVVVTDGDALSIDVEGDPDAVEALRFVLDEDTLGIHRSNDGGDIDGRATVRVTMPSPKALMLAGSGGIAAQSVAPKASINMAGSGRIDVANLEADDLDVNIMGSGTVGAAGSTKSLALNIAGSGNAEFDELEAQEAEINIAGSGNGAFASDGTVKANVMGSGDVTVFGRATCTVNALGSGSLTCKPGDSDG